MKDSRVHLRVQEQLGVKGRGALLPIGMHSAFFEDVVRLTERMAARIDVAGLVVSLGEGVVGRRWTWGSAGEFGQLCGLLPSLDINDLESSGSFLVPSGPLVPHPASDELFLQPSDFGPLGVGGTSIRCAVLRKTFL